MNAEHFYSVGETGSHHCANRGVHSGSITTAGEHGNFFDLGVLVVFLGRKRWKLKHDSMVAHPVERTMDVEIFLCPAGMRSTGARTRIGAGL